MEKKIIETIKELEAKLTELNPTSEEYLDTVTLISELVGVAKMLEKIEEPAPRVETKPTNEFVRMTQVPIVEEEDPSLTFEEVKGICSEAMSRGVKVKNIIMKYTDEGKLTAVDKKDYAALVAEVKNA